MTEDELYSVAYKVARSFVGQIQHRHNPEEVLGAAWIGAKEGLAKAHNLVEERGGGLQAYVRVCAWRACKTWFASIKDGTRRETHRRQTKGNVQSRMTDCDEDYDRPAECEGLAGVDQRDELAFMLRNMTDFDLEILCGTFGYGLTLVELSRAMAKSEATIRSRRQRKLQRVRRDLRLSQLWKLCYEEFIDDETIAKWEEIEAGLIQRERLSRAPTFLELQVPDQLDVHNKYCEAMHRVGTRGHHHRMGTTYRKVKRTRSTKREKRTLTTPKKDQLQWKKERKRGKREQLPDPNKEELIFM